MSQREKFESWAKEIGLSTDYSRAGGPHTDGDYLKPMVRQAWLTWRSAQGDFRYPGSEMSLRDWFAGQALTGLIGISPGVPSDFAKDNGRMAEVAYSVADAMIEERAKR